MPAKVRVFVILMLMSATGLRAEHSRAIDLDEVVVESAKRPVLHMLAYVREYSTLSTYDDTVRLFREKYVDFMLPPDNWKKHAGWTRPRPLASRSYYRFTDAHGKDSVSDAFPEHFSWSDWTSIFRRRDLHPRLRGIREGTDTLPGRYGAAEIWRREGDRIDITVDLLADPVARSWIPSMAGFLDGDIDFQRLKVHYRLDNIDDAGLSARDISCVTYEIESDGRGRNLSRLLKTGGGKPCVTTRCDIYIIDKEYISAKEAREWERGIGRAGDIEILPPPEAPELSPQTIELMARVDNLDRDAVRLAREADRRLASFKPSEYKLTIVRVVKSLIKKVKNLRK